VSHSRNGKSIVCVPFSANEIERAGLEHDIHVGWIRGDEFFMVIAGTRRNG